MKKSISSAAVLVDLSIGTWEARKLDKAVTEEVNTAKHASHKAARVNKSLFPGASELEEVTRYAAAVRNWMYTKTLPWSDHGSRLLVMANFFDFKKEVDQKEVEFWRLVDVFVGKYQTLVSAQAFQLGDMFQREEYPHVDEVRGKFKFFVSFAPVPESGDFRVDINNEMREDLLKQFDRDMEMKQQQMLEEVRGKLLKSVKHMIDRLGTDENGKPNTFRGPLVDKFVDAMVSIRQLNIVKDDIVDQATLAAERAVAGVTTEELRKSPEIRKDVQTRVQGVLDAFSW